MGDFHNVIKYYVLEIVFILFYAWALNKSNFQWACRLK